MIAHHLLTNLLNKIFSIQKYILGIHYILDIILGVDGYEELFWV